MSDKVTPALRLATPADAALLAEGGRRTFYDAFHEVVDPVDMEAYLNDAFDPARVASELADPDSLFLLAFIDDAPAGYAKLHFGPPHPSVSGDSPVKLWRLYAEAKWYGRGVGTALMAGAMRAAQERGARTVWLTVNIHNRRAIGFYERAGLKVVGRTEFMLASVVHQDHVMAGPVPNPAVGR